MPATLIKNAYVVNEGTVTETDVLIVDQRIEKVASNIQPNSNCEVIEAKGCYLIPGMIDDQVHFREPGLIHKGTIASESRAAVAGGVTSYMEMPNVSPPTVSMASSSKPRSRGRAPWLRKVAPRLFRVAAQAAGMASRVRISRASRKVGAVDANVKITMETIELSRAVCQLFLLSLEFHLPLEFEKNK